MARMKPAALLQQSRRKKVPSRLSIPTILLCSLVVILMLVSLIAFQRHRNGASTEPSSIQIPRKVLMNQPAPQLFAIMNTTLGIVTLELFPGHAPKTVENFVTHSRNGYYKGVTFHRVIKDFMIQGGDPTGTGSGGTSIWRESFGDEFTPSLKHEPFTLSMANSGKDTNGSQFFITTVATPHLDGRHTVFGRVVRGQDVVKAIEGVQTDGSDKPLSPVVIQSVEIVDKL